jgi:hypothetical protein
MSDIIVDDVLCLIDSVIDRVEYGVGTFINIYSRNLVTNDEYQLWIYLAEWAITKNGIEVISSDKSQEAQRIDQSGIIWKGLRYERVLSIDYEELKILLSDGVNIEMWANSEIYSAPSIMAHIFRNGISVGSITFSAGAAI